MMSNICTTGVVLCLCMVHVVGFASWFATDYCSSPLAAGEIIMNHVATASEDRKIEVYRNDVQLKNGDQYYPGERLSAVLGGDDIGEMVWDCSIGVFEDGGCEDKRSTLSTTTMIMPTTAADGTGGAPGDIEIWAGWATSHSTVWISSKFVLKAAAGTAPTPPQAQAHAQAGGGDSTVGGTEALEEQQASERAEKQQLLQQQLQERERLARQAPSPLLSSGDGQTADKSSLSSSSDADEQLLERQKLQQHKILEQQKKQRDPYRPDSSALLKDWNRLHDFTAQNTVMATVVVCAAALGVLLYYYRRRILTYLGVPGKYGGGLKRYRSM